MLPPTEIPASVAASTLNQRNRFAAAYSILEDAIAEHAFPGATFGIVQDGKIVALDAVGRFTYHPDSRPVTPTTVYDLASVTKVVATTTVAMLLYVKENRGQSVRGSGRRRFDLDEPVGDLLPGFVIGTPCPEPPSGTDLAAVISRDRCDVTLRHLLAHSSGLPAYARLFETARTPAALLAACLRMPLEAPPGSRSEYSDIGFILLGKAIELICGEPLDAFCAREVFAPLGMTATRYRPPTSWRDGIPATVDDIDFRGRIIQGEVHDENCFVLGGVSGHAGLFSNALDVLRFASCILAGGKTLEGRQIFDSATIQTFSQRQIPPPENFRALGWDTPSGESSSGRHFSPHSIGHLGYTGTSLWIDLERSIAVTLLTNRTWPDRSSQAIRRIRPAFHDAIMAA